jgi:hypothetical protein
MSLLGRAELGAVKTEPYAHLEIMPALDWSLYEELQGSFPPLEVIVGGQEGYGSNQAVRLSAREVIDNAEIPEIWRDFFTYHVSKDWWGDIVRVMGRELRRSHPNIEARTGRALEDWRVILKGDDGEAEVRLDCLFVYNTPVTQRSSVKGAHVDRADKIFSALFYCRHREDDTPGGDLRIYRIAKAPVFDKHQISTKRLEGVKTVRYDTNKLLCFVNSLRSVHSVTERAVTPIPRRYVNLVVETPFKAFKVPQMNWASRLLYRRLYREWTRTYQPDEGNRRSHSS